jgi:hypothetical protein
MWMVSFGVIMDVKVRKKFVLGSRMTFFLNVCVLPWVLRGASSD